MPLSGDLLQEQAIKHSPVSCAAIMPANMGLCVLGSSGMPACSCCTAGSCIAPSGCIGATATSACLASAASCACLARDAFLQAWGTAAETHQSQHDFVGLHRQRGLQCFDLLFESQEQPVARDGSSLTCCMPAQGRPRTLQ